MAELQHYQVGNSSLYGLFWSNLGGEITGLTSIDLKPNEDENLRRFTYSLKKVNAWNLSEQGWEEMWDYSMGNSITTMDELLPKDRPEGRVVPIKVPVWNDIRCLMVPVHVNFGPGKRVLKYMWGRYPEPGRKEELLSIIMESRKIVTLSPLRLWRFLVEDQMLLGVTLETAKELLQMDQSYQLAETPRRKMVTKPIQARAPHCHFQLDITWFSWEFNRRKYILTMIDTFSKYARAWALTNRKASTCWEAVKPELMREIEIANAEHLLPVVLHTDNGGEYMGEFKEACDELGSRTVKQVWGTPYTPWSQGHIERFNGSLKNTLRRLMMMDGGRDWPGFLQRAVDIHNRSRHSTTGLPPDVFHDATSDPDSNNQWGKILIDMVEATRKKQIGNQLKKWQGHVLKVGDFVRLRERDTKLRMAGFKHGITHGYSLSVWKVVKVSVSLPDEKRPHVRSFNLHGPIYTVKRMVKNEEGQYAEDSGPGSVKTAMATDVKLIRFTRDGTFLNPTDKYETRAKNTKIISNPVK